jgi:hypothetical protein
MNNYLRAKVIGFLLKNLYIYNYEKEFFSTQNSSHRSLDLFADGHYFMHQQQKVRLPESP